VFSNSLPTGFDVNFFFLFFCRDLPGEPFFTIFPFLFSIGCILVLGTTSYREVLLPLVPSCLFNEIRRLSEYQVAVLLPNLLVPHFSPPFFDSTGEPPCVGSFPWRPCWLPVIFGPLILCTNCEVMPFRAALGPVFGRPFSVTPIRSFLSLGDFSDPPRSMLVVFSATIFFFHRGLFCFPAPIV